MNEIEAVRRLAAEPSDESVARTWGRITKLASGKPLRRRRRLVPAVAGLAVTAVLGASVVVYRAGEGVLFAAPSAPQAVALLNSMADLVAAEAPVTVAKGQLVQTDIRGVAVGCDPAACWMEAQDRVVWYDPHEGAVVRMTAGGVDQPHRGEEVRHSEVGINRPTLRWLSALPSDPQRLLSSLRMSVAYKDSWTVDHKLWDAMAQLYMYCENAILPAQRASLLRALAGVSGLSVRDLTVDGVPLVAIRQSGKTTAAEIIFDPATGHAVGRAMVFFDDYYQGTVIPLPGRPALAKGVVDQVIWQQSVT